MKFAYKGKSELVGRTTSPSLIGQAARRRPRSRRAARGWGRRLPRGIGLTIAVLVSLGLWALLGYAVTRLLGVF